MSEPFDEVVGQGVDESDESDEFADADDADETDDADGDHTVDHAAPVESSAADEDATEDAADADVDDAVEVDDVDDVDPVVASADDDVDVPDAPAAVGGVNPKELLDAVRDRPISEHAEVYEELHTHLQRTLAEIDGG